MNKYYLGEAGQKTIIISRNFYGTLRKCRRARGTEQHLINYLALISVKQRLSYRRIRVVEAKGKKINYEADCLTFINGIF